LFYILTPHFTPVAAVVVDFSRFWWENKTETKKEYKNNKKKTVISYNALGRLLESFG
jgi:hypothetical protein